MSRGIFIFFLTSCSFYVLGHTSYTSGAALPAAVVESNDISNQSLDELLDMSYELSFKDMERAVQICKVALKKAESSHKQDDIFKAYRNLGLIYENNNNLNEALTNYNLALGIAENSSPTNRLTILGDIAITYKKLGDYKKSREFFEKTKDGALELGDHEMLEAAYDGLGQLYETVGDFTSSVKYYYLSLNEAEKNGNRWGQIVSYQNLASAYRKAKNYKQAEEVIKKAGVMAQTEKDTLQIANVFNDYGEILADQGRYEEAAKQHQQALPLYQAVGFKSKIAESYMNNATAFVALKQYEKAEQYFLECFKNKENFWNYEHAVAYLQLGELYLLTNRDREGELSIMKGLEISDQYGFKDLSQRCNHRLFELNKARGNFSAAFQFLNRSERLRDSLFFEDQNLRVAEAQFRYDVDKRNEEIQALKERNGRNLLVALSVIFSLVFASLLYIVWLRGRNNKALVRKNSEIEQQNKRLEESNEILRQFAYAAAHDLKEPLRSIGSFINLIQRRSAEQLSEESKEYMGFVVKAVKRMNNLLTDLLQYSTVITQNATDELLNTKEVISEVSENLHSTIQMKQAVIECDESLPSVHMNRLHLTQLMQNLISNSLKFAESKPVVKIAGHRDHDNVIITITDNGIGIKQEYGEKIFNLFHQLHKHTGKYEGTGIGLTICKNIVEKYNGRIWFESEENKGTRFFIALPSYHIAAN